MQRRARRLARRRRTTVNLGWTLAVTVVTTLVVYAGIASYAAARADEIPPVSPAGSYQRSAAYTQPYGYGYGGASGQMRRCPATGCTASTCHAETGEPIPGRH